jgi:glycine/D-amino acid oxidase-like deaminating enzyme
MVSPLHLAALGTGTGILAAPGVAGMLVGSGGIEIKDTRAESLWTSELPVVPHAARFEGERHADLAIVGGGCTGLSCACYAKKFRPDWTVMLLESHRLGSGASSRNSGAVYAQYWGLNDTEMPQRGLDRLFRFIEEEQIDCDLQPRSTLELYTSSRSADRHRASLEEGAEWISADELREGARTEYYAGAAKLSSYYTVHPAKLAYGHVKAAQQAGVEIYESSPVLEVKRGKPAILVTPAGTVRADNVFIATNAYTPRLGFLKRTIMPVHQYTLATRRLTEDEIGTCGLDQWPLRFERRILPVTTFLTPSGHFCIRIVLGYASFNSCMWRDLDGARTLARKMFEQRYPWIADVDLVHGWHGVTGHTLRVREVTGPLAGENIHASVAYNGLGIMPGHNNGYLSACRITGRPDQDLRHMAGPRRQIPIPGEYYRSIIFKPFMKVMAPD